MLTTPACFSSVCTEATNAAWQQTKKKSGQRRFPSSSSSSSQRRTSFTCKPVVSPLLFFLYIYSPISSHMVWFPWKQRLCKKKKTVSVSEFFSSVFLSLFPLVFVSLVLSLSLPPPLAESQAVCRAINIINQHNSTALSSAGRDEEARGNVNMPAWSSLNQ